MARGEDNSGARFRLDFLPTTIQRFTPASLHNSVSLTYFQQSLFIYIEW